MIRPVPPLPPMRIRSCQREKQGSNSSLCQSQDATTRVGKGQNMPALFTADWQFQSPIRKGRSALEEVQTGSRLVGLHRPLRRVLLFYEQSDISACMSGLAWAHRRDITICFKCCFGAPLKWAVFWCTVRTSVSIILALFQECLMMAVHCQHSRFMSQLL